MRNAPLTCVGSCVQAGQIEDEAHRYAGDEFSDGLDRMQASSDDACGAVLEVSGGQLEQMRPDSCA
jgi:hypothetical protein